MRQPKLQIIANDNTPLRQPRIRKSFGQLTAHPNRTPRGLASLKRQKPLLAWVMPALAILSGVFIFWQSVPLTSLFWPSVIIGGLMLITAARSERDSRLRNISGLLMVAAFAIGLAALLAQNGFTLIGMELALLVSTLSFIAGWIFKSKPAVLLSAFSGLIYLASYFPELGLTTGLTDQISQLGAGLIPWLILGQIILSQSIRSSIVLFVAVTAGYIWLGLLAKDIPLPALAGLSFAIAAAQYWLGNTRMETGGFGANIHRVFGWVIALVAALYTQYLWLNFDAGQATPFWPPNTLWWTILGAAMFTIFITSLMRYKTSHISLFGIFILCSAVLLLPAATAKPNLVYLVFDAIPGLNARPGLGLVIGAAIIAAGLLWLIGGLKSGRLLDICLGALAIGIETMVLFRSAKFDVDLGVIFIVSLICALCVGGLVAGASPERPHSHGNYA